MDVTRIDHVNIRIPEDGVDRAVAFYQDVLGFAPEKMDKYRVGDRTSFAFRLGDTAMLHVRPVTDFEPPGQHNYDHFCIIVDESIEDVKSRLQEHDVVIDRESTPWGSTGRAPAVYITDPFGYRIEIKESG